MLLMLTLAPFCRDISRAWSDASIDEIASLKETMKSILRLDTLNGNLISVITAVVVCWHLH